MKRGLFLLATFTLSSALYGQASLTPDQAREVFGLYNPALLEKASQQEEWNQLLDTVLQQFLRQNPEDTLENRYTLIALARNFDNSLALNHTLEQYYQALVYSQYGTPVYKAARQHASNELNLIYPRIWAVTVQVKEALLNDYQHVFRSAELTAEQKKFLFYSIEALKADLKNLKTHTGEQLTALTQEALEQVRQQALSDRASLLEENSFQTHNTDNLQVKTKHKKPVAE